MRDAAVRSGPTGAQGARGPTGAQGPTGPAGPGAVLVKDSNGIIVGTPASSITANSYLVLTPGSANGACEVPGPQANYYFPVVATYDLSTLGLAPPFSVQ